MPPVRNSPLSPTNSVSSPNLTSYFFSASFMIVRPQARVVINMNLDRPHAGAGGDFVAHDVALGIHFLAAARGAQALDGEVLGLANLERPEHGVQVVAGHVADRAGAELAPVPPAKGMQTVMVIRDRAPGRSIRPSAIRPGQAC